MIIDATRESIHALAKKGLNTRDEDGDTPLMIAAFNGYQDTMKSLIDQGADINLADHNGRTPLICAKRINIKIL